MVDKTTIEYVPGQIESIGFKPTRNAFALRVGKGCLRRRSFWSVGWLTRGWIGGRGEESARGKRAKTQQDRKRHGGVTLAG